MANGDDPTSTQHHQSDLVGIRNSRTYEILNGEGDGTKKYVEREELAKGYEYGRTAVHISESDLGITKLDDTEAGMDIIGFALREKVSPRLQIRKAQLQG